MEKRQLDLNKPLLSARRYSSPSKSSDLGTRKVVEKSLSLPVNKSNLECEAMTKRAAASVPFQWEQIPGRPKGEIQSHSHTPEEPSSTPRLPPGRLSDALWINSGEITRVPPAKVLSGPIRYCSGERSNDPNIHQPQIEGFSLTDHASLLEKLNESLNCNESDSESGDEAYSDALDTLSQTESWSFNYSVSGLSGYQSSGVKPSGTFAIDTQTRDFMMNRFLPAAKAVALETPKNVAKKPSALSEQPKEVRKAVSGEVKPSLKQYSSDALSYYNQYIDNVESEDEGQECKVPVKKSWKAWGILPRICVKNSLCLLNPLPSMKSKGRPSASKSRPSSPSTREVRRLMRKALSGPLDKNACPVVHKKKFYSGLLSRDMLGIDNKSTNDSNNFLNSDDSIKSRLSPLRRYRSGSISPYRNESPKSPFREGVGFLGVPKEVEDYNASKIASSRKLFKALQDVSRNQINERGSCPATGDPVEKTVYIDYVKKKDVPSVKPSCLKAEADDFSFERLRALADEITKPTPKFGSTDKNSTSAPKLGFVADGMGDMKLNQSLDRESRTLEYPEVPSDANFVMKEEQKLEPDDGKEFDIPSKSPLPPPLPKSPTESWLWRTLPSMPLGNPFANSRRSSPVRSRHQGQKGSATNTKWETIVKTSNIRHDHVRYSEELVHHSSLRPKG